MQRTKYPLAAAAQLREGQVDEAKAALAGALETLSDAESGLADANRKLQVHRECTAAERKRQNAKREPEAAQTLLQVQHYFDRRGREEAELVATAQHKEAMLNEAKQALVHAQEALAKARAELKAVEKHRERWQEAQRKRQEAKAEEDVDDIVTNRKR